MLTAQQILSNPAFVGVWNVDSQRSTIGFRSSSLWGLLPVKGRFKDIDGDAQIVEAGSVYGRIDVVANSLDTKMRKRDEHLRSADFFDTTTFPTIRVAVTSAQVVDVDNVELNAQLTVKDVTESLLLPAKVTVLDDGAVRISTRATINRGYYRVDGNMAKMIGDTATITGDIVFKRAS